MVEPRWRRALVRCSCVLAIVAAAIFVVDTLVSRLAGHGAPTEHAAARDLVADAPPSAAAAAAGVEMRGAPMQAERGKRGADDAEDSGETADDDAAVPANVDATNAKWVVELADGDDPLEVAHAHGFTYVSVLAGLRGFHRFRRMPAAALRGVTRSLRDSVAEGAVLWAEPQIARKRETRALRHRTAAPTHARTFPAQPTTTTTTTPATSAEPLLEGPARRRAVAKPPLVPHDPLFERQWHLPAAGVPQAWLHEGVTGAGVLVAIVDDGLAFGHADFAARYVAAASRDVNGCRAEPLPQNGDTHGTEAAGVAAAAANLECGVGAAPDASVAGVRVIGAPASDADEAEALLTGLTLAGSTARGVAIYSCSWGPSDDGRRLERPGRLTELALERGTREGRGGRGAVYVWACGNGKQSNDRADHDAYASSRYVIAVGAVGRHGLAPWYSEPGAAVLVVAPSSDGIDSITTSRAPSGCTGSFGGTSAAAPLVAGIVALMLEARPELGWRDVRHVLARTATRVDAANADWQRNGGGLWTSHQYGYGAVNATAAVALARRWPLLPAAAARLVETSPLVEAGGAGTAVGGGGAVLERHASLATDIAIESVELDVSIACAQRGVLTLTLTSPAGTRSEFLRPHGDVGRDVVWRFTSARLLGERSRGLWVLRLGVAAGTPASVAASVALRSWSLRIHGS